MFNKISSLVVLVSGGVLALAVSSACGREEGARAPEASDGADAQVVVSGTKSGQKTVLWAAPLFGPNGEEASCWYLGVGRKEQSTEELKNTSVPVAIKPVLHADLVREANLNQWKSIALQLGGPMACAAAAFTAGAAIPANFGCGVYATTLLLGNNPIENQRIVNTVRAVLVTRAASVYESEWSTNPKTILPLGGLVQKTAAGGHVLNKVCPAARDWLSNPAL